MTPSQQALLEEIVPAHNLYSPITVITALLNALEGERAASSTYRSEALAAEATLAEARKDASNLYEMELNYRALLFAVERKFPNESRYETALRYIKAGERKAQVIDAGMAKKVLRDQAMKGGE